MVECHGRDVLEQYFNARTSMAMAEAEPPQTSEPPKADMRASSVTIWPKDGQTEWSAERNRPKMLEAAALAV